MLTSFPKCSCAFSNLVKDGPEAGLRQSNYKQSTDPFSSKRNLFVTLPTYNIPLFLLGALKIAA